MKLTTSQVVRACIDHLPPDVGEAVQEFGRGEILCAFRACLNRKLLFYLPHLTCTCTIMPWNGLKTIELINSLNTESLRSKDGQTMARGERVTSHSHLKHEQSYYVVHYSKREGRKKEMDKHWQSTTAPKGLEKKIILYIHIPSLSSLETYVHLGLSSLETYLET